MPAIFTVNITRPVTYHLRSTLVNRLYKTGPNRSLDRTGYHWIVILNDPQNTVISHGKVIHNSDVIFDEFIYYSHGLYEME